MLNLPLGITGEFSILVDNSIAVTFLGEKDARVLGTPFMIGFLEMTARDFHLYLQMKLARVGPLAMLTTLSVSENLPGPSGALVARPKYCQAQLSA